MEEEFTVTPMTPEESIDLQNNPIPQNINNESSKTEDFVTGLPEWDLAPPYEMIRRVTRR